jgi:hypothetical protein
LLYRNWEESKREQQEKKEKIAQKKIDDEKAERAKDDKQREVDRVEEDTRREAVRAKEKRQQEEDRQKINLKVAHLKSSSCASLRSFLDHIFKQIMRIKGSGVNFDQGRTCENGILRIERSNYEQLMDELEDCHLKIQNLRLQFDVREDNLFGRSKDRKSLKDQLESSEKSLIKILVESEKSFLVRRNMGVA